MVVEYRTQRQRWFVETGYVDCGGTGRWDGTKESVEVEDRIAAEALRDEWLTSGKLEKMSWGELRPTFSYGCFCIRSVWEDVKPADEITALRAQLAAAEADKLAFGERVRQAVIDKFTLHPWSWNKFEINEKIRALDLDALAEGDE